MDRAKLQFPDALIITKLLKIFNIKLYYYLFWYDCILAI